MRRLMLNFRGLLVQLCLIVWTSCVGFAQTKPSDDAVIADFEPGHRLAIGANNASASTSADDAAQGTKYLRIKPSARGGYVRLGVPGTASFVGHERLSAQLRAPGQRVELLWMALNERRQPIFIHKFKLEAQEGWQKIESPLRLWRWPEGRAGDWDEVKEIALRIEADGVDHVDIDDVRLEENAPADERTKWLLKLAFADRATKTTRGDAILVATEAVEAFADADLQRLADQITAARTFVRRVFGDAVWPIDDLGSPPMLLIFSSEGSRGAFLDGLGAAWNAQVKFGGSQGFTVHDIATTTYVQKLGTRRPVYLHEGVHAIVARDLRLVPGHVQHGMLQEAIANYLQICADPSAIAPDVYPKAFAQPVDGKGIFKPLDRLLSGRATSGDYAQLASLFAYLVEKDQPLLRDLFAGVAEGSTVSDVLARRGPTFSTLQDAWLAWGRARFKQPTPAGEPIFERPIEFR